jgi:O-methyltransferase
VANPENRETDTVAIREFNAMVHRDKRVLVSLLPVADGLTLLLKR